MPTTHCVRTAQCLARGFAIPRYHIHTRGHCDNEGAARALMRLTATSARSGCFLRRRCEEGTTLGLAHPKVGTEAGTQSLSGRWALRWIDATGNSSPAVPFLAVH